MRTIEPIIQVDKVYKYYRKRKSNEIIKAVQNVSFEVNKGEIIGLLGQNGAGKTTLIKLICGLLTSDSGDIFVKDINIKNRKKSLNYISAVFEGYRNLYWRLTVRENLEYFMGNRGVSRKEIEDEINKILIQFNLKQKEDELVHRLSRGMQQKLAIALTILADSEIILLDEPTLGLDVETSYEVRELLKDISVKSNRTIIISSHDMQVVQDLCERTIIINDGNVVTDNYMDELLHLFEMRSYHIKLGSELIDEQIKLLVEQFPEYNYTPKDNYSNLDISLSRNDEIYFLFDILRLNNTPVDSIEKESINFEQIFLEVIKEDRLHALG